MKKLKTYPLAKVHRCRDQHVSAGKIPLYFGRVVLIAPAMLQAVELDSTAATAYVGLA